MKKTIFTIVFALFGFFAKTNAQTSINISTELSLDTSLGSDITTYPNSTTFPGNYELNLRVRAMVHSGHYGQFTFSSERRAFGTTIWGTFSPNISQFPSSGITNIYNQSAKTYQAQGTVYEYRIKVIFVAQGGAGTKTMYTPIRKATIIGVPKACFSMYNIISTQNEPSYYGNASVHTICQNAVTINGSCSEFETGYHIRLAEFNLSTWTFGTEIYNNWVSGTGQAPSFISLNALAATNNISLVPNKLYIVSLSVGPIWNSATAQFFRVIPCRESDNSTEENLQDLSISEVKLYPNPVKDELTLTVGKDENILSYTIYNNIGSVIKKGDFSTKSNEQKVNVNELNKGIYSISIETNTRSYREKIIKE